MWCDGFREAGIVFAEFLLTFAKPSDFGWMCQHERLYEGREGFRTL